MAEHQPGISSPLAQYVNYCTSPSLLPSPFAFERLPCNDSGAPLPLETSHLLEPFRNNYNPKNHDEETLENAENKDAKSEEGLEEDDQSREGTKTADTALSHEGDDCVDTPMPESFPESSLPPASTVVHSDSFPSRPRRPARYVTHPELCTYVLYGPYGKHHAPATTNHFLLPMTLDWKDFQFLFILHSDGYMLLPPYDYTARYLLLSEFKHGDYIPTTIVEAFVNKWVQNAIRMYVHRSDFYWHRRSRHTRPKKRTISYNWLQRAVLKCAIQVWREGWDRSNEIPAYTNDDWNEDLEQADLPSVMETPAAEGGIEYENDDGCVGEETSPKQASCSNASTQIGMKKADHQRKL